MRRVTFFLLFAFVVTAAAEVSPQRAYGFGGFLEPYMGNVVLTPSFKFGYQVMGLNINVPIPQGANTGKLVQFHIEGLDATIKSAPMWMASGRLAAQLGDWYFFAGISGAIPRTVIARFDSHPVLLASGANVPLEMTGSRLSSWLVEGGTGVEVYDKVILFTGLRRDQVTAALGGPRFEGNGSLSTNSATHLNGDLLARLWIPYVGVNVSGPRFCGSLACSPFAFSQLKLPWTRVDQENLVSEQALYSFQMPGLFLEGKFDTDVRVGSIFDLGVWLRGTWQRFRGEGEERLTQSVGVPASVTHASGSWKATINRYEMALGFTAAMAF